MSDPSTKTQEDCFTSRWPFQPIPLCTVMMSKASGAIENNYIEFLVTFTANAAVILRRYPRNRSSELRLNEPPCPLSTHFDEFDTKVSMGSFLIFLIHTIYMIF
jgi:hypothetical protein